MEVGGEGSALTKEPEIKLSSMRRIILGR
jgi:hypothetical protein